MWFIKNEFWNEFQTLIENRQYGDDIRESISRIKIIENFCKEGKGISFYSRSILDNKLLKEIERYKNDNNYREYGMKDIKES